MCYTIFQPGNVLKMILQFLSEMLYTVVLLEIYLTYNVLLLTPKYKFKDINTITNISIASVAWRSGQSGRARNRAREQSEGGRQKDFSLSLTD